MTSLVFLIAAVGMVLQGLFITVEHNKKFVLADVLKGLAALMFVTIGLIGYIKVTNDSFGLKIVIGLVFGLVGDVLLNLRFVSEKFGQKFFLGGIVAFLVGHILYLAALIPLTETLVIDVVIGAVIAIALLAYIFVTLKPKMVFRIFGVFYLGAVIIMTVIGVHLAIATGNTHDVEYAIGAVLFMVSDIVLIFNTFSGVTRFSLRITNLSLYYIGQLLIAGSLFLIR